jgi:enoyl-CoA hydratase/carnithine racemase
VAANEQTDSEIEVSRKGYVATVRLTAAHRLGALTPENNATLHEVFVDLGNDPEVRAIIITGTGRGFCSGAEVGGLEERAKKVQAGSGPAPATQLGRDTGFTPRRSGVYKPVIAAVNGICAAAGLHFIADADIVIAAESATFLDPHTTVGQVAALEPILFVRGGVPLNAIMRMVILGRGERLDAHTALRLGLVSEVVPDDQLLARAEELGELAAEASPAAVQASIKAIWEAFEYPLSEAYRRGHEAIGAHRSHPDSVEGPKAFAQKRKPEWANGSAPEE